MVLALETTVKLLVAPETSVATVEAATLEAMVGIVALVEVRIQYLTIFYVWFVLLCFTYTLLTEKKQTLFFLNLTAFVILSIEKHQKILG